MNFNVDCDIANEHGLTNNEFEKICNCDLQFVATSQAGSLSSDIFVKGKDVILGVEHNNFDTSYDDNLWAFYDYVYFPFIYHN